MDIEVLIFLGENFLMNPYSVTLSSIRGGGEREKLLLREVLWICEIMIHGSDNSAGAESESSSFPI